MNPITPHVSKLFADRDTIEQAMQYANTLLNSITDGQDKIAAWTALMVVVNTAAKLWPETQPEAPAQALAQVQADLDHRLVALANRVSDLEQSKPSVTDATVQVIQAQIRDWADDSFNDLADDWLCNHADLGQEIENWMENNLDVENEVRDVLNSANLSITF